MALRNLLRDYLATTLLGLMLLVVVTVWAIRARTTLPFADVAGAAAVAVAGCSWLMARLNADRPGTRTRPGEREAR